MNENVEPLVADDEDDDGKRQRSTIAFPYGDFDKALEVATAVHGNVGHGPCSQAQLSAWMNQSVKSSGFRIQLAAARLFGLIESDSPENIRLTELGRQVVDPVQSRTARADSFLKVPLFKSLYEKYKSGVTPPAAALEREIVGLGVSEKQKSRARQVFESSATQTGFREAAPNRLVQPAVVVTNAPPVNNIKREGSGGDGGDGGVSDLGLDPLLMALLRKIPKGGIGKWPQDNRVRWFRTFAMNVSQVYDDDQAPVELDIKVKVQNQNDSN
jgi:hypothetical protein